MILARSLDFDLLMELLFKKSKWCLHGINQRFQLRCVNGPLVFTTDQCCDEHEFIAGTKNAGNTPIFATLVSEGSSSFADGDKEELLNGMLELDIDLDDIVDTVAENPTLVEIDQLTPLPNTTPSAIHARTGRDDCE
jgi:hypothetical protein